MIRLPSTHTPTSHLAAFGLPPVGHQHVSDKRMDLTRTPLMTSESLGSSKSALVQQTKAMSIGNSPIIKLNVTGKAANCVIDTGSMISCVSTAFWDKKLPDLSKWRLRSATGEASPLYGPVEIIIKLNGTPVRFPVFVAAIADDCLIGADFLKTYQAIISLDDYSVTLTLRDRSIKVLHCSGTAPTLESRRFVRTLRTTGRLPGSTVTSALRSRDVCLVRSF